MIDFNVFGDLETVQLSPCVKKPKSLTIGQLEASRELWVSSDGRIKAGVWQCTEGQFTADRRQIAEYCHIISGSALIENEEEESHQKIQGGDLLVLPKGWKDKRTITEQMRKLYILSGS